MCACVRVCVLVEQREKGTARECVWSKFIASWRVLRPKHSSSVSHPASFRDSDGCFCRRTGGVEKGRHKKKVTGGGVQY